MPTRGRESPRIFGDPEFRAAGTITLGDTGRVAPGFVASGLEAGGMVRRSGYNPD